MKKLLLLLAVVSVLGFSSCTKKCYECTIWGFSEEVCQDDFDSKEEFKDAIDEVEAWGGECK